MHFDLLAIVSKHEYESHIGSDTAYEDLECYIYDYLLHDYDESVEYVEYDELCTWCDSSHKLINPNPIICVECNGTRVVKSTYNTESKFDSVCVGGRWSGNLYNININHEESMSSNLELNLNSISISELLERDTLFTPYAIVTYHDGWEDADQCAQSNWANYLKHIYTKYSEDYGILLDCHM